MLTNLQDLQGYAIRATDGDIGTVRDFYFDDERWTVRYLVVESGTWLASRKVLITPFSLAAPNREDKVLPASITQAQVRGSPDIDTDQPVSRQHEADYLGYYGYPVYWGGPGLWGGEPFPGMMSGLEFVGLPAGVDPETERAVAAASARRHAHDDPHLRSCKNVQGYHLRASDGEIGHVAGYIVDDKTWTIRYLVADTSNWWIGKKVLIAPQWISSVNWEDSTVAVDLTQQAVKSAPAYDPDAMPTREQEAGIYQHYERPGYW